MLTAALPSESRFPLATAGGIPDCSKTFQQVPQFWSELTMHTPDEIEANRARAAKGWIADPPPTTQEPVPESHINKWRLMNLNKRA